MTWTTPAVLGPGPLRRRIEPGVRSLAVACAAGLVLGVLTWTSWQIGITVGFLAVVALVYASSLRGALMLSWAAWLFSPLLRRLIDLAQPASGPDLISVAPFAAILLLAVFEIRRVQLPRILVRSIVVVGIGLAIGVPAGLVDPLPMAFALFAYGAGVSAIVLGYSEGLASSQVSLTSALRLFIPVVAVYGLFQYALPLPPWDANWLAHAPITSIGTKATGDFRVFSVMNAPGTVAPILAVAVVLVLTRLRLRAVDLTLAGLATACLAVTFVRSAWISLLGALVMLLVLGRGRYVGRVLGVVAVIAVAAVGLGGRSAVGGAVVKRASTIGHLGSDQSGQARLSTTSSVFPIAIRHPMGEGLGSVGQARVLSNSARLFFPDNGYLAVLYQLGPPAWLMIFGTALTLLGAAIRRRPPPDELGPWLFAAATVAFLLVFEIFGDALYGLTGVILWYMLGYLTARSRRPA